MQTRRWLNPSQPQTLQIAVFLLYIHAVFALVGGRLPAWILLITVVGGGASGFGIANERRWGYLLGVAVAFVPFLWPLFYGAGISWIPDYALTISGLFDIALIALLLHPQSRDYQRIWFK